MATLRRAFKKIKVYPGFNHNILEAIKVKLRSLPADSNLCALVFDEMALKETVAYNPERDEVEGFEDFGSCGKTQHVANHATVFLVRGHITKWKQAVGYVVSSGPINGNMLQNMLLECLDKLDEAGLNVKLVIADQGSNNRRMFETLLKVREDAPYLTGDKAE